MKGGGPLVLAVVAALAALAALAACSLGFGENYSGGPAPPDAAADGLTGAVDGAADGSVDAAGGSDASDAGDGAPNDVTRGLVVHYRFDEPTGAIALDSSPNGNTGLFVSGTGGPPTRVPGKIGSALAFAGGAYVEAPRTASLKVGASFSVAFWANAPANNGQQPRLVALNYDFDVKLNGANPQLSFLNQYGAAAYDLVPNRWTHFAVVFEAGRATWFIDAAQVPLAFGNFDGTLTPKTDPFPLRVGTFEPGNNGYTGMLDDVRIYDVALTKEEIATLASP